MEEKNTKGIGLLALVGFVVSSAIGAGVFGLPSSLAEVAAPGPALLAWLVVGFGIMMLALSLNNLVLTKPELTGVGDYARAGFGDFAGFISGWGYWLSAWLGNVAFATFLMSTCGWFFPELKSGNSWTAIIIASIISWLLVLLVSRGVEGAAVINGIVTVCKLIPLVVFVFVALISFKAGIFTSHFWTNVAENASAAGAHGGSVFDQIKNVMMSMMWVFVGIEGATMMSARAKNKNDAGKATMIGVTILLAVYILASILPYGYMSQKELATINQPGTVYILKDMMGSYGEIAAALFSIGIIISILGSWLSWTMLPAEATVIMAEQRLLPSWFKASNKFGAPIWSLLFTQVLTQAFMFTLPFSDAAYNFAYSLCTAAILVCYALVGAYELKLGLQHKNQYEIWTGLFALIIEIIAMVLAGLNYLLLCATAYLPGFIFFIIVRKQDNVKIKPQEKLLMLFIIILSVIAIVGMMQGWIQAA